MMGHNFQRISDNEERCLWCDARAWTAAAEQPCPPSRLNWQDDPTEPPIDD